MSFCSADADLPEQWERMRDFGYDVEKTSKNGTIETINPNGAPPKVHIVCHLDKELYKCVTLDIVTDSVIITDERIKHIRERHPNDFEMYSKYMKDIIHNPDYILEANKPNTALIIKNIEDNDLRLILCIAVISDNPYYSNSVISFQKTHKGRLSGCCAAKKYFTASNKKNIINLE